jgi:hypothetical protein
MTAHVHIAHNGRTVPHKNELNHTAQLDSSVPGANLDRTKSALGEPHPNWNVGTFLTGTVCMLICDYMSVCIHTLYLIYCSGTFMVTNI